MLKQFRLLLILCFSLAVLIGCWPAQISSQLTIDEKGAGSKTIVLSILKDGIDNPDGTGKVENEIYFKQGYEGLDNWIESNTPEGFTVVKTEDETQYIYSLTYEFTSLEDYIAKTKALVGEENWEEFGLNDPVLTITEATKDGKKGKNVTFTEDVNVLYSSTHWAISGVYANTELFDANPKGTGKLERDWIYEVSSITLKVGDTEATIDLQAEENGSLTEVTLTGFVPDPPSNTLYYIIAGVVAVLVVVVVVVLRSRTKKSK